MQSHCHYTVSVALKCVLANQRWAARVGQRRKCRRRNTRKRGACHSTSLFEVENEETCERYTRHSLVVAGGSEEVRMHAVLSSVIVNPAPQLSHLCSPWLEQSGPDGAVPWRQTHSFCSHRVSLYAVPGTAMNSPAPHLV